MKSLIVHASRRPINIQTSSFIHDSPTNQPPMNRRSRSIELSNGYIRGRIGANVSQVPIRGKAASDSELVSDYGEGYLVMGSEPWALQMPAILISRAPLKMNFSTS